LPHLPPHLHKGIDREHEDVDDEGGDSYSEALEKYHCGILGLLAARGKYIASSFHRTGSLINAGICPRFDVSSQLHSW
jgi:hypothetical protein